MDKRHISLDKVLSDAWKRMVQLLFHPFDFKYWLIIGFCAWMTILIYELASVQQRILSPLWKKLGHAKSLESAIFRILRGTDGTWADRLLQEAEPYTGVICLCIGIYIVYLILCLGLYFLRCRFEFVFLANLLRGTREIRAPWREFKKIGNSYFAGSLLTGCLVFLYYAGILALFIPQIFAYLDELSASRSFVLPGAGIWICLGILLVSGIIISYYMWFFYQLLLPIMYRDNLTFRQGLRVMNRLLWRRFGACFLYYLVVMIVWFGFLIAVLLASACTCCIFLLLLTCVPYVRVIIVLPPWVFYRLLGAGFLEELDPRTPSGHELESAPGEGSSPETAGG